MSEQKLMISPKELQTLVDWVAKLDPQPHKIALISGSTGIGSWLRAEIEISESEGLWKDVTDYDNW